MSVERIGSLRVRTAGKGERGGPAVLLCHGFGAPGDDLVPLADAIDDFLARVASAGNIPSPPRLRWFFPEAPLELDLGMGPVGRAWWEIDMERIQRAAMTGESRVLMDETPRGLADARAALESTIDALTSEHGVSRDRLIVGGFSQGGMLATEVALFAKEPFAGLAILSGTLLSRARWEEAAASNARGIHAIISHGRADPLLPFKAAEELRGMLERGGAQVTWVPHNGQHEIPSVVLAEFVRFVLARLG